MHIETKPDNPHKSIDKNLRFGMSIENPFMSPYVEEHRLTSVVFGDVHLNTPSPLHALNFNKIRELKSANKSLNRKLEVFKPFMKFCHRNGALFYQRPRMKLNRKQITNLMRQIEID